MVFMTQQEIIQKFMYSLDLESLKGEAALDAAVKYCSNFTSIQEVINKMIYDCSSTTADDFLKTYCGIDIDNDDTGAITGWDAGGSEIKTAESIVPEDSLYQEYPYDSFYVNGLTVKLGDVKNDEGERMTETTYNELSAQQKYLWNSLYSYWLKSGLDLITESYGSNYSFTNPSATTKTMYVSLVNKGDTGELAATWGGPAGAQKCTNTLQLDINLYYYGNATGEDGEVTNGQEYLDRTLAHELTHATMRSNIDYFDHLPAFIKEGMAELTHGIDNIRTPGIMKLAGDSSLLEKTLVMETVADKVYVPGVSSPSYSGGYMFLRYFAKQSEDLTINNSDSNTKVKTFYGNDSIKSSGSNVTIDAGKGNDSISASGDKILVNADAGNNFIYFYANATNVTVNAGNGADSVDSGAKDAFLNTGAGNDSIHLYANAENHTVNTDDGADSVYSGAQTASINTSAGNDYIHIYSNATKNTVNAGIGNDYIRSYNTNGILYQQKAGDGSDTINGFTSNDTISISGSTYYTQETIDSSAVRVSLVSGGAMSLLGAASLEAINVEGSTLLNVINNSTDSKKITVGAGESSITNYGNNVTVLGASNKDSIWNYGDNVSMSGSNGENYFYNSEGTLVTIKGGNDNDQGHNFKGELLLANMGGGNDYFNAFEALNNTILGGSGNDTIQSTGGDKIFLDGENDNDEINSWAINSTLVGGAGDDTIKNNKIGYLNGKIAYDNGGQNAVIIGGAGNDSIKNVDADNVLFKFNGMTDGNDTITGFNATSTLQFGDGTDTYSKKILYDDWELTSGNGKVLLQNVNSLSNPKILGREIIEGSWVLSGTTATYGSKITVSGVKSVDGLSLSGKVVTVADSSLNNSNVTISEGYTLVLASDVVAPKSSAAAYDSSTQTYTSKGNSEGYKLSSDKKSISYSAATTKDFKFSGVADEATASNFYLSGTTITIGKAAVQTNGTPVKLLTNGYTLKLGKGMGESESVAANYADGVYTTKGTTAGYNLSSDKKSISCVAGTSREIGRAHV